MHADTTREISFDLMDIKYNKQDKQWTLTLSNGEMAQTLDAFLFADIRGEDEYAKAKRKGLDALYKRLQKAFHGQH